jgi:hypothetical protein
MKHEELVAELEELARRLGVTVRYEKGDFEGGFCILRDQRLVLVNKKLTPQRKASVLALAMQDLGLDSVFVKPALRAYIEDEVARTLRSAQP